jgi:AraC-like DNA-binding protein
MKFSQVNPDNSLASYIDAYWTATGDAINTATEKILPDGCIDIIFNLGADCLTDNGAFNMQNEKVYLVGTMTRFKETVMHDETKLIGVRFKPAGFSAFHKFSSLQEITDKTIEYEKVFSFDLKKISSDHVTYFNQFFSDKLKKPNHFLFQVIETIRIQKGQIKVEVLASKHFTTVRQLERSFKQHIGISPKQLIDLTRYQNAMTAFQTRKPKESILSIAIDSGYYDHAHLTNEFKRYNGVIPTLT